MKEKLFKTEITANHKLVRKAEFRYDEKTKRQRRHKDWIKKPIKDCKVMIIGKRNLYNGITWYETINDDLGVELFDPRECIKAYLVVKDVKSNPFYIIA